MLKDDIIKLNEYGGIEISVGGCIKLMCWSHLEERKGILFKKLSIIEHKQSQLIENEVKDRHSAHSNQYAQESDDCEHLVELLTALENEWIRRLDEGVKTHE